MQSRFFGKWSSKKHNKKIDVNVDILEYQENGIYYVYSPALDLVGYGKTVIEARESWQIVLDEYLRYTNNKNTLVEDLIKMGWTVNSKGIMYMPPTFTWMLQNNDDLNDVFNKHDFNKVSRPIKVPMQIYA